MLPSQELCTHAVCLHPGITLCRVTTDANRNVHPVSFGRYLASESTLSVGAHITAEQVPPCYTA